MAGAFGQTLKKYNFIDKKYKYRWNYNKSKAQNLINN